MTEPRDGRLGVAEHRFLIGLGAPGFIVGLSLTMVSMYLPVVIAHMTGAATAGMLIGTEGLFGLLAPFAVGMWSDHVSRTVRDRLSIFFASGIAGTVGLLGLAGASAAGPLGLTSLLGASPHQLLLVLVVALIIFYVAHFGLTVSYLALYPDLLPLSVAGRARGIEVTWRAAGSGFAVILGGLLLAGAQALPFLVCALAFLTVPLAYRAWMCQTHGDHAAGGTERSASLRGYVSALHALLSGRPEIRGLIVANVLWSLALAAVRAFVVLFLTVGLGDPPAVTSVVFAIAAIGLIGAPILAGRLADHVGAVRVLRVASWIYGLGLLLPFFAHTTLLLVAVPFIAGAAAVTTALPYAMFMHLMPAGRHGVAAGVFGMSEAAGALLGPVLAGVAIELCRQALPSTHGYDALWPVAACAVLFTLPLLRKLRPADQRILDAQGRASPSPRARKRADDDGARVQTSIRHSRTSPPERPI